MRKLTHHALTILSSIIFELSYGRKMLMKPHIDQKYHLLCTRAESIGDNLFGDDISKRVKDINDAQKIQGYFRRSKNVRGPFRGRGLYTQTQTQNRNVLRGRGRGAFYNQPQMRGSFPRGRGQYKQRKY